MKKEQFFQQFNWRFLLVRILVNALTLALTAAVLPKIYFVEKTFLNWLLMAIMLGVLNAIVKPLLQFLTLQFLFATFGFVVILVNTLMLLLLAWIFPDRFAVESLLWALLGGLVFGLLGSFLESLMGLTIPVTYGEPANLRLHPNAQENQSGRLATINSINRSGK